MAKTVTLALLALLVGAVSGSAAAQEGAPAADADEVAVVTVRRHSGFVSQPYAARQDVPGDGLSIAREAQKELQRLGCFEGELNGAWSQSSRVAAQRFLDRVNAKLPTDKVDEALLSLLKAQSPGLCGLCPRGQELDAAGSCVPAALLKRSASATVTGSISQRPDERAPAGQLAVEQDQSTSGGQRAQANSKPSKWRRFIRSVDKALGLN